METLNRSYKTKDVDMLVTASTIIESAISNKAFLQTKRSTWADPFFENFRKRIDDATQNFLGVDSAKDLRQATQVLTQIQKQAIKDLAEVKVQLTEDFKSDKIRRDEMLKQLGFTDFHKPAQKGDQEALIQLLYQFKKNLTAGLQAEIIAKGTAKAMLGTVTSHADTLRNSNVNQESFKGSRKTITAEAVTEFNAIYDQLITICKLSAKFFKEKPAVKDQFSFSKVSKALNKKPKGGDNPPPPQP